MKVWVTRSQPGASATAERVRHLGHDPIVAPLLIVEPLAARIDLGGVDAVAFTSANGVRAFAGLEPRRDLTVWTVGGATAHAAREAGFGEVRSSEGDVAALAADIAAVQPPATVVLHPRAEEPAGDLETPLEAAGIGYAGVALYRTREAKIDAAVIAALAEAHTVLLHSPKGARVLDRLLSQHPARLERALCLSGAVAAALGRGKIGAVACAALPNDAALLKLL